MSAKITTISYTVENAIVAECEGGVEGLKRKVKAGKSARAVKPVMIGKKRRSKVQKSRMPLRGRT